MSTAGKRGKVKVDIKEKGSDNQTESNQNTIVLGRSELYLKIWSIGLTRTAKEYGISYPILKKACRNADVPLPTQSYWGSISVGKQVERTPLPKSDFENITIVNHPKVKERTERTEERAAVEKETKKDTSTLADALKNPTQRAYATEEASDIFIHKKNQWGGTLYERETLYQELWKYPVVTVAKTYGVSDVMIHKICKKLNVPTPPQGYWAKKRAGKQVDVIPLPKESEHTVFPYNGSPKMDKNGGCVLDSGSFQDFQKEEVENGTAFSFLGCDEYKKLVAKANQLCVAEDKHRLHRVLQNHKHVFAEWSKLHTRDELAAWPKGIRWHIPEGEPAFWASVSQKSLGRVYSILDALFCAVESLGGAVQNELCLIIR